MKYLAVISMLLSVCESYNILVLLPYPGKSHHMVFEPILDELTRRGHNLTVVSFFPSSKLNARRRDVSLVGLAPLSVEVVDLTPYDDTGFPGQNFLNQFTLVRDITRAGIQLCEKLLNSHVFEEFVNATGDYDVILLEHFNSDCMLGIVHEYKLPSIGLMSCALMPWTPTWVGGDDNPATFPSMMLPLTDEMSFFQKVQNTFDLLFYQYLHVYVSMNEQKLLETRLGRILPPLATIGKNASVVLVNTHHTLNGVRALPPSVVEVGGIHLHNKTVQPLPKDLEEWVSGSNDGIILFSFGSLIKGSTLPPKRLDAILKAFARLPQRIVWKWEAQDIQYLPKNVIVQKWLPQYDLLNHPNCVAFITHGGLLSLTEAVAAGVPALIIPILGDQPGNAAYAKVAGIAEVLDFKDITEDNLFRALKNVLTIEKRVRAKEFSNIWKNRPVSPMDTAIHFIEKTAKYGNLNMSSPARLLSRPQLLFFNCLCYIIVVSLLLIVLSCCSKKSKVKVKQS